MPSGTISSFLLFSFENSFLYLWTLYASFFHRLSSVRRCGIVTLTIVRVLMLWRKLSEFPGGLLPHRPVPNNNSNHIAMLLYHLSSSSSSSSDGALKLYLLIICVSLLLIHDVPLHSRSHQPNWPRIFRNNDLIQYNNTIIPVCTDREISSSPSERRQHYYKVSIRIVGCARVPNNTPVQSTELVGEAQTTREEYLVRRS